MAVCVLLLQQVDIRWIWVCMEDWQAAREWPAMGLLLNYSDRCNGKTHHVQSAMLQLSACFSITYSAMPCHAGVNYHPGVVYCISDPELGHAVVD